MSETTQGGLTPEQIAALHPVENTAPASQESVEGKLESGEEVKGVRWLDVKDQKEVYQMEFQGKLYMADKVGAPNEFLFKLI